MLIIKSGFQPLALAGGVFGFSVQQAIRQGLTRSVSSTESGVGASGILFGSTGSTNPFKDGLMGMLTSFITSLVCFITGLCIIASGVWNSGANGAKLTSQAFATVFGNSGNWIVMILSISFGIGVTVTYAYITREAWLFLTKGRYVLAFGIAYSLLALLGALIDVEKLWSIIEIICALMVLINLLGGLLLLPLIRKGVKTADATLKK